MHVAPTWPATARGCGAGRRLKGRGAERALREMETTPNQGQCNTAGRITSSQAHRTSSGCSGALERPRRMRRCKAITPNRHDRHQCLGRNCDLPQPMKEAGAFSKASVIFLAIAGFAIGDGSADGAQDAGSDRRRFVGDVAAQSKDLLAPPMSREGDLVRRRDLWRCIGAISSATPARAHNVWSKGQHDCEMPPHVFEIDIDPFGQGLRSFSARSVAR